METDPTIFIVDDDPAVRQALTVLVRSMHLQAEAYESAQQFLDAFDAARPGCLLLDVRMPGISGLGLLEQFNREEVPLPAIVMSAYGDVPMVVRAMKAGALNFLEKPCRDQQLWEAIQEALKWDSRPSAAGGPAHARSSIACNVLPPANTTCCALLIDGKSNKTIAAELNLSVRTIEVRRAKLMKKMKAESLAELIRLTLLADSDLRKDTNGDGRYHRGWIVKLTTCELSYKPNVEEVIDRLRLLYDRRGGDQIFATMTVPSPTLAAFAAAVSPAGMRLSRSRSSGPSSGTACLPSGRPSKTIRCPAPT